MSMEMVIIQQRQTVVLVVVVRRVDARNIHVQAVRVLR